MYFLRIPDDLETQVIEIRTNWSIKKYLIGAIEIMFCVYTFIDVCTYYIKQLQIALYNIHKQLLY